ncbi:hypothetical protein [Virgisporangium aurantiacum]|uniref:Uncharacterized protein n=1 Tax=Virgisporangium aurantiacum TaxID=175570 RepID=A0A8J3ZKQ5_9ACTN|nr:hypothetical protein [Virgisporangium aurantiacum]GIJ64747.1 hypothetical protein Vau01_122630 [Virgisporangium aurantiacum]
MIDLPAGLWVPALILSLPGPMIVLAVALIATLSLRAQTDGARRHALAVLASLIESLRILRSRR